MTVDTARFTGFGADAVAWFRGLEADNSRAYFEATRGQWEAQVRDPLAALLTELSDEFGGVVKLFRQTRDVRFSPDKSPYKTTTYGILYQREGSDAGLYAQMSARGLYAGTGYHQMARDQLERYHLAAADDRTGPELAAVVEVLEAAGLEIGGEALKTAPRGFARDHPRVRLLRHKELVAGRTLPPGKALATRRALEHSAETWRAAAPLNAWLDRHVGPSAIPPEVRWGRG